MVSRAFSILFLFLQNSSKDTSSFHFKFYPGIFKRQSLETSLKIGHRIAQRMTPGMCQRVLSSIISLCRKS